MKYLLVITTFIYLFSCKEEDKIKQNTARIDLQGNWYSIKGNNYQEYYFTEDKMYTYNPYSGDVLEYSYFIKEDSIFRYLKYLNLKDRPHEYFNRIIRKDSFKIHFNNEILSKVKDTNTLEMFINKKINKKTYDAYGINRERLLVIDK